METKITLIEKKEKERAEFYLHQLTPQVEKLINQLGHTSLFLFGELRGTSYKLSYEEILYIEIVDKKTFLYTNKNVYQNSEKLYQLAEKLSPFDFIRVSKSMLLNLDHVTAIAPTFSGRFTGSLSNGEQISISRKYVAEFKAMLGMEDSN